MESVSLESFEQYEMNPSWDDVQDGIELLLEGEYSDAVNELSRITECSPSNEYAFFFLGCAHFERHELGAAIQSYTKALEIAPNYLGAMVHLGQTLCMLGKYTEAIRLGEQVLYHQPQDADALYLLGAVYYSKGDRETSADYFRRFLETGPELESALEVEGMIRMLQEEDGALPPIYGIKN